MHCEASNLAKIPQLAELGPELLAVFVVVRTFGLSLNSSSHVQDALHSCSMTKPKFIKMPESKNLASCHSFKAPAETTQSIWDAGRGNKFITGNLAQDPSAVSSKACGADAQMLRAPAPDSHKASCRAAVSTWTHKGQRPTVAACFRHRHQC